MSDFIGTKYKILGVNVDVMDQNLLTQTIKSKIQAKQKTVIFTPYSEFIYRATVDPRFLNTLNSADISLADGVFIQIASLYYETVNKTNSQLLNFIKIIFLCVGMVARRINRAIVFPQLLSGSTEVFTISDFAEKNNFSIGMIGGSQNVVYRAAQNLEKQYPELRISVKLAGRAFSVDDKKTLDEIDFKKPDILFVCYGAQKQEKWIYEFKDKINANVIIGLGGTFDYLSGKKKLQSAWWSDHGLNWLHRLISDPWRINRQTAIFKVMWKLAAEKTNPNE